MKKLFIALNVFIDILLCDIDEGLNIYMLTDSEAENLDMFNDKAKKEDIKIYVGNKLI